MRLGARSDPDIAGRRLLTTAEIKRMQDEDTPAPGAGSYTTDAAERVRAMERWLAHATDVAGRAADRSSAESEVIRLVSAIWKAQDAFVGTKDFAEATENVIAAAEAAQALERILSDEPPVCGPPAPPRAFRVGPPSRAEPPDYGATPVEWRNQPAFAGALRGSPYPAPGFGFGSSGRSAFAPPLGVDGYIPSTGARSAHTF